MERIKALLKQQHRELDELTSEVQRKEVTPARIIRLMKIVQRNVELSERIVTMLEQSGLAKESSEAAYKDFKTKLE